jgi:hypothetical protein
MAAAGPWPARKGCNIVDSTERERSSAYDVGATPVIV